MASSRKAVGIVVALLVAGLLVGVLFPVAINAISGPADTTVSQDTGETYQLSGPDLNATLDEVTEDTEATYTIETETDSETVTVNLDETETATVDGYEVDVTPTEIGTDSATTQYEYPRTYGWGGSASAMWGILPIMIVLAALLMFVQMAVRNA